MARPKWIPQGLKYCKEIGAEVSASIRYRKLKNDTARNERWAKDGVKCSKSDRCEVDPQDCPIYQGAVGIIKT